MSHHPPFALDLAAYAAEYAERPDRTLGVLLDSNVQVIRRHGGGDSMTLRESQAKYSLLMTELHGRAQLDESERRSALITRFAISSTASLKNLERELLKAIDHRACYKATRRIHREKLVLVRAELRDRELGNDQLPERDTLPEED